jgi:hypothetical protein
VPVQNTRVLILGLACQVAVLSGCDRREGDRLVVATSWPTADRQRMESDFADWLAAHPEPLTPGPIRLEWLILAPSDDIARLAARRGQPDVLLGGPARGYEQLSHAKRLVPLPIGGSPAWIVARRAVIRVISASCKDVGAASTPDGGVAFDDPRNDPISLAWLVAQLEDRPFGEGYARLVRAAGERRRIGRQPGSAAAAVGAGDAERAPGVVSGDQAPVEPNSVPWIEGVAILDNVRHPEQATSFLKFLVETGRAGSAPARSVPDASDVRDLLADLLGATLVDAQDEVWDAWSALERTEYPQPQLRWMTEPPPWPPASIAKILTREGEQAMSMVETLAGQLATHPSARSWLIRSWLSPPRLIDREVLEELTRADDGRLIREPRLREWLRAEWTAWARQRYRRVLRAVGGKPSPAEMGASSP